MSRATTLAQIITLTLTDATVHRYTMHDADLTVGGQLYKAVVGVTPTGIERDTDLAASNLSVRLVIDDAEISDSALRSGRYAGARFELVEVDYTDPDGEPQRMLLVGFLGETSMAGPVAQCDLQSLESELAKPIGRTVQLRCDADLGDTRCGYSLIADSLAVTSVSSDLEFSDSALSASDGHYNGGKLTWTSGANAGLTFDIKRSVAGTGTTIELWEPTPYPVQVGDDADIYRGCDKTFETCRDTFDNVVNFRGFNRVPGVKDMVAGEIT